MKIAIITAGGAGMFCGSCMQDNTLVRALRMAGEDAVLVPTYTPIRVDEEDVSNERVFLGGINIYLDSNVPGWRFLPRWMTGFLNRTSVIRSLSKLGAGTEPSQLGSLTLDILKGAKGPQRREIHQLCDYLCNELQPDVIIFSNALLSGVLSELRPRFSGKLLCLLQGDDIFLEALSNEWKPRVLKQMIQNCKAFDGFLTHSTYYRRFMVDYLQLPDEKFREIPLTIDDQQFNSQSVISVDADRPTEFRVGYFARICPEKGVHNLLKAAEEVLPDFPDVAITIAGYLPEQNRVWFEQHLEKSQAAIGPRVRWLGSPDDRSEKFRILKSFDLLCVPTNYHEPKGLYVLEAGLIDVPVLVPNHGAFPELIRRLKFGTLYDPTTESGLSDALRILLTEGRYATLSLPERVSKAFGIQATGATIVDVISSFTD